MSKEVEVKRGELLHELKAYFVGGGLFNPEMAIHDNVRDLLIKCRDYIENSQPKGIRAMWGGDKPSVVFLHDGTKISVRRDPNGAVWMEIGKASIIRAAAAEPVVESSIRVCELCGEPMPPGEEVFKFHGYSGPCPPKNPDEGSHRNWTEDFNHENGRYLNNCIFCHQTFKGHKRRVCCKLCSNKRK
jgi:hypothetical protein